MCLEAEESQRHMNAMLKRLLASSHQPSPFCEHREDCAFQAPTRQMHTWIEHNANQAVPTFEDSSPVSNPMKKLYSKERAVTESKGCDGFRKSNSVARTRSDGDARRRSFADGTKIYLPLTSVYSPRMTKADDRNDYSPRLPPEQKIV